MKKWLSGLVAGLLITAVVLLALAELMPAIARGLADLTNGEGRWAMVWLIVLGSGVGVVILLGRANPSILVVPALLLLLLYLPVLGNQIIPSWYPDWLGSMVARSFGGGTALVVTGAFAGAAVWSVSKQIRRRQLKTMQVASSS